MATTIRARVDNELTRRVGKWFTVREIQDKLRINPSTLKPLIMKYAREHLLRRRHVKGTARSVEFSPAANSIKSFQSLLTKHMPYRNLSATAGKTASRSSRRSSRKGASQRAGSARSSRARRTTRRW